MIENQKPKKPAKACVPNRVDKESGHLGDQKGIFVLMTGLIIVVLFAFTALGVEVGRWYIARAELSKAVDAAALIGAKNLSNPYLDDFGTSNGDLMVAVANANFSPGFMGSGTVTFTPDESQIGDGKVAVTGGTHIYNQISRVLEVDPHVNAGQYEKMYVNSKGVGQHRDVEIMMVLDRSGSMSTAMDDLKVAATSFLDYFQDTEANDKFGLVSFATEVTEDYALANNFVTPMTLAIDDMNASGWTNTEDAIDRSDDDGVGFTDQTGLPGEQVVQQFLVFFSDGNPTAFRVRPSDPEDRSFVRNSVTYDDAIVSASTSTTRKLYDPATGNTISNAYQYQTGDGLPSASTMCPSWNNTKLNMKWNVWDDSVYGSQIYQPLQNEIDTEADGCLESSTERGAIRTYVEEVTKQMALDHAQEIKDKGIKIYTIGLGSVDQAFLGQIASGPAFEYYTPNSSELKDLFQKIATNIKLRLVQ